MKFIIKQYLKMFVQGIFLPIIYLLYKHRPVQKKRVIFADAHHENLPFSMQAMHQTIADMGFEVIDYFYDYGKMNKASQIYSMIKFMKLYATAKYVFLCDYYLPASACRKKSETILIQLWHCGGMIKKMGFDTSDDIPSFYKLNPHKNYDLMTVSSSNCVPFFTSALHLSKGIVQATGISRSDIYFNTSFIEECRNNFFQLYPEACQKKIVLWTPTFRGNASNPFLVGKEDIEKLQQQLGPEWILLIKVHPYIERQNKISNCEISSEKLLPVIDVLITDYSTILFDYLIYQKPFVLFAPDYDTYKKQRGFCIDYHSLPGLVITEGDKLALAVKHAFHNKKLQELKECYDTYMGKCDGQSTQRILSLILDSK
ncbi:CDP-glycerol glycerophosphotransferase family protein [Clostridiaceae bacterium]|nr:CDP-glycerol glycerophosphotransferase family protein [Clostridiaceae bacterium]